ncbi:hypothetical protein PTSG_12858 [Salpingoeca rosetta]|uniref:Chitobiosyldiphosphodolichol beta-mannosyltransferase n=1 Tax=Salpingoeca rosetta (strain ATCC 50818 / BSB-021) TaxID=946362 RepID=F2UN68_SALR5|nr:uncharacterized protein PTSG_12858 [Salpingoeca rosetta]EGD78567.1 hypothetical protein PTSG_12858 [Salpingoeca rosetta]|eukprot:XP_004989516.1 hypothetical protein PTSG_12858 [Salpingoeca rosetta]
MLTMTMMMMLFVLLLLVPVVVVLARLLWNKAQGRRRYVCVLVLGDLGRSPRMQYHVLSLSKTVEHVFTVAYAGSRPVEDIVSAQNITFVDIPTPPTLPPGWPRLAFVLYAPVKVVLQSVQLVYSLLFRIPACTHLLMQNPPSIPAMPIAVLVCWLTGTTLVIDWHNYGFSILALKLGKRHVFVRLSEWIERTFGRLGSRHLCVTDAMARDLRDNWGITATTLHDRPPKYFKPKAAAVTHDLFMRFEQDHKRLLAPLRKRIGVSANQTLLTTKT